jgi:hypothetical protein
VPAGRFELKAPAGALERVLGGRLAPGPYRAAVRVKDAAGNAARTVRLTFRVVRRTS